MFALSATFFTIQAPNKKGSTLSVLIEGSRMLLSLFCFKSATYMFIDELFNCVWIGIQCQAL